MHTQTIPTGDSPAVVVDEVHGSLEITGWSRAEVMLQSSAGDEQDLLQQENTLHVRTMGDCLLRVPEGAQVQVVSVHGGARIKLLEDGLKAGRVLGSLSLRDVGEVLVESVYGDLSVRQVKGSLTVKQVLGNASIRQVQGSCALERVAGNLELRDAQGDLSASVGGNARLSFSLLSGQRCHVDAGGNLSCRVPPDAPFQADLTSGAQVIQVSLPGDQQIYKDRTHQLHQGEGGAALDLSAGGMLSLASQASGASGGDSASDDEIFPDLSAEVEAQIASHMKTLDEQMAGLSAAVAKAGLSPEQAERIMRRARESSERATVRAQEKIQRAQERMKHKMEAAQRRVEQKATEVERRHGRHSWSYVWPSPPAGQTANPPAGKPGTSGERGASDEERLLILRMLEQKKISLEEAEKLLAALEGK